MDEDRRIRFFVAPFMFLASLAWGMARDPKVGLASVIGVELKLDQITSLLAAIAGAGLALFPLGFAIGTITYVALRLVFEVGCFFGLGSRSHEIYFSAATLPAVWRAIEMPDEPDRKEAFIAGVVFDYDVLAKTHEPVHRWLFRRWNAFSISITSTTALVLSLVIGGLLGIEWRNDWHWPVIGLCVVLVVSAILSWRDTMAMAAFMARRTQARQSAGGCGRYTDNEWS
jgi:hypothetical protein